MPSGHPHVIINKPVYGGYRTPNGVRLHLTPYNIGRDPARSDMNAVPRRRWKASILPILANAIMLLLAPVNGIYPEYNVAGRSLPIAIAGLFRTNKD